LSDFLSRESLEEEEVRKIIDYVKGVLDKSIPNEFIEIEYDTPIDKLVFHEYRQKNYSITITLQQDF